jgi:parallel beta-helix repeat protein
MRRMILAGLHLSILSALPLIADEGRIPIFQASTISVPGAYVLTRDINIASGDGIVVQASGVNLDLNSHTISSASTAARLILISGGFTDVTIRNGRLVGGRAGIWYFGTDRIRLHVEKVEIANADVFGIYASDAEQLDVSFCWIHLLGPSSAGIQLDAVAGPTRGQFINNRIEIAGNQAMLLSGLLGGEIRDNLLSASGTNGNGLTLSGPTGVLQGRNLVEGNTVNISGSGTVGIRTTSNSVDNLVLDNVVTGQGYIGIAVASSGNRIAGNIVNSNGSDGIAVLSARNLFEGNLIEDNAGCGLNFFPSAAGNAYRNNMLRNNTGGAVCGTANTDAGGNIL